MTLEELQALIDELAFYDEQLGEDECADVVHRAFDLVDQIGTYDTVPDWLVSQLETAVDDVAMCVWAIPDEEGYAEDTDPPLNVAPSTDDLDELPDEISGGGNWTAVVGGGLIIAAGIGYLVTRKK
ncbi:MAG: hypothetical protein ABFR47_09235 [Verrucomicrobiota bacterium]